MLSYSSSKCGPGVNSSQVNENGRRQVIPQPVKPIGQIRTDIEDEHRDDQPQYPECGKENAESAGQRLAGGHRRGVEKRQAAEAHQCQTDECKINPEQSANERWKRRQVLAQ